MGKDFNKTWEFFSTKDKNQNVKFWLTNPNVEVIHQVNKLKCIKFSDTHYCVINEETKHCRFFDTEQECIDYCLDVYPSSFYNEQLNLFEDLNVIDFNN